MTIAAARSPLAILAERLDAGSERYRAARERDIALADIGAFARHAKIQDPLGNEVAFAAVGWGWQFHLLSLFATGVLIVVLKARQLGVSWLAAIYALWSAMRRPGQSVLLISKGQGDSDKLLDKVAYVYERLPAWKPYAIVNVRSISFPDLGSEIEALPATEKVGRSRTATLVILDEHAHQPWARKIFLAVKGAAERGQVISISTANGLGALHTKLYQGAKAGTNGWRAVFIPARAHPARSGDWRTRVRAEMSELDDAEFTQEYPENDREAFIATGRPVFADGALGAQPIEEGVAGEPGLMVYREPQPGRTYVIGADVAEGLAGSDWSSAAVLERDSGEQVAQLRGRWAPDVYAEKLDRLARRFAGHATGGRQVVLVGIERNNHGHAAILRLVQLAGASAPYAIYRAPDKRRGWLTTTATRPVLVDQLEEAIRTGAIMLHDAGSVDQFGTFHWSDDGRPEAEEGFHDDDVLAVGIAWQLRRRAFGRVLDVRRPAEAAA